MGRRADAPAERQVPCQEAAALNLEFSRRLPVILSTHVCSSDADFKRQDLAVVLDEFANRPRRLSQPQQLGERQVATVHHAGRVCTVILADV